ncbi:phosphoribosyltransferase-like protein [Ochromonadaceae sp. CCMP2298]|nr:phosphoribosyltransferase-like protein [Ochromonadaceae sp. CCMP2298]
MHISNWRYFICSALVLIGLCVERSSAGPFSSSFLSAVLPPMQAFPDSQGESKGMEGVTGSTASVDMGDWNEYFAKSSMVRYQVIAAPGMEGLARRLAQQYPKRFLYHETHWGKFPDGTDNIEVGGFQPVNRIASENVLMLASFHNNDVTLSQFSVMITLLQSFVQSLTVVLPFYPVGTMERVVQEGQVATANSYAQMFSNLPSCGRPTRLVIYDLHTLQNRFYLHGNAIASLQTSVPLLIDYIRGSNVDCVAFPDDGAAKRFGQMFQDLGLEVVTCGKMRDGDRRVVTIQDGSAAGKNVVIVDDLVQTGGTLYECGMALKAAGATSVSAFVAHAVFPNQSWRRFLRGSDRGCFDKFLVTNSIPTVTDSIPRDDVFTVLDLSNKIVEDLDKYS